MNEFEIQITIGIRTRALSSKKKVSETSLGKAFEFFFGKRSFHFTWHILARRTLPDRKPR